MSDTTVVAMIAISLFLVVLASAARREFLGRDGRLERGFRVARQDLPNEMVPFVQSLADGYSHEQHAAFILRQDSMVLVQPVQYRLRKDPRSPFVGFVDLDVETLVVEYRLSIVETIVWGTLLVFLFAFPWILAPASICDLGFDLFLVAYFAVAYVRGKSRVLRYIESAMWAEGE